MFPAGGRVNSVSVVNKTTAAPRETGKFHNRWRVETVHMCQRWQSSRRASHKLTMGKAVPQAGEPDGAPHIHVCTHTCTHSYVLVQALIHKHCLRSTTSSPHPPVLAVECRLANVAGTVSQKRRPDGYLQETGASRPLPWNTKSELGSTHPDLSGQSRERKQYWQSR